MSLRKLVVAVGIAMGFGVGAGLGAAQVYQPPRPVPPKVIEAPDVGFRIEGIDHDNTPIGRLVVKINGQWIEARVGPVVGAARPAQ